MEPLALRVHVGAVPAPSESQTAGEKLAGKQHQGSCLYFKALWELMRCIPLQQNLFCGCVPKYNEIWLYLSKFSRVPQCFLYYLHCFSWVMLALQYFWQSCQS